jgi:hypothetical protein
MIIFNDDISNTSNPNKHKNRHADTLSVWEVLNTRNSNKYTRRTD